jgi:hypothetical protein
MSFDKFNKAKLIEAAQMFGVDYEESWGKSAFVAAFLEEGVTYDQYVKLKKIMEDAADKDHVDEESESFEEESSSSEDKSEGFSDVPAVKDKVLVKMERENPHYIINGMVFTKDNPFALATEEQYEEIVKREKGFRLATQEEAKAFYA